ncbi:MAG: SBBP repeat-containing protein [Polyangiales bacterium]
MSPHFPRFSTRALAAAFALGLAGCADAPAPAATAPREPSASDGVLIENVGQFDAAARFEVRGALAAEGPLRPSGWLTRDALWLTLRGPDAAPGRAAGVDLRVTFPGANPAARVEPFARVTGTHVSYFRGEASRWRADVPVWAGVRYVDLYPGVDLVVEGRDGAWRPRFEARAEEALRAVRVRVEGADAVADVAGGVRVTTRFGALTIPLPRGLQGGVAPLGGAAPEVPVNGVGRAVSAAFTGSIAASTFLGGKSDDQATSVAALADGSGAVVGGFTRSSDLPTSPGAYDGAFAYSTFDAFAARFNASGARVFVTYLGGSADEGIDDVAVDSSGNVYATGSVSATTWGTTPFPVTSGAYDATPNGGYDAFIAKLSPLGTSLIYSSLFGGAGDDTGDAIAVINGLVTIAGSTTCGATPGLPFTPTAYASTCRGTHDVFLARFGRAYGSLTLCARLGGSSTATLDEGVNDLALDASGAAYLTGYTQSPNFPVTAGVADPTHNGDRDAFVTKLNPAGDAIVWSTFLGGANIDDALGIAVDSLGYAFVAGATKSPEFPVAGAYDATHNGGFDAFVMRLTPTGAITWSTFFGGSLTETVTGIALYGSNPTIVGYTDSAGLPVTVGAAQAVYGGQQDAYVARFTSRGGLSYSTFLGGDLSDSALGVAADPSGGIYVAGHAHSMNFPTTPGAFQPVRAMEHDAFLTRF